MHYSFFDVVAHRSSCAVRSHYIIASYDMSCGNESFHSMNVQMYDASSKCSYSLMFMPDGVMDSVMAAQPGSVFDLLFLGT